MCVYPSNKPALTRTRFRKRLKSYRSEDIPWNKPRRRYLCSFYPKLRAKVLALMDWHMCVLEVETKELGRLWALEKRTQRGGPISLNDESSYLSYIQESDSENRVLSPKLPPLERCSNRIHFAADHLSPLCVWLFSVYSALSFSQALISGSLLGVTESLQSVRGVISPCISHATSSHSVHWMSQALAVDTRCEIIFTNRGFSKHTHLLVFTALKRGHTVSLT